MNRSTPSLASALRFGLLPCLVAAMASVSGDFLSLGNLGSLGDAFALLAPVALGVGLTMMAGEFDLTVGATVAVSGLIMAKTGGDDPALGLALGLGFGVLVGAVNGALTLALEVSSLVTTLGVMIVLQGAAVWIEGGQAATFDDAGLTDFIGMTIFGVFSPRSLLAIALFGLTAFLLRSTRLGRDIRASGSRRKAAIMSGVNVRASILAVFVLSGVFAALDGALLAISLGKASSQFGGSLLIQAATAAILGGVALSGGVGGASGIALGALALSVLGNGLSLVGADSATILLLNGAVLLLVVLAESDVTERLFRLVRPGRPTEVR